MRRQALIITSILLTTFIILFIAKERPPGNPRSFLIKMDGQLSKTNLTPDNVAQKIDILMSRLAKPELAQIEKTSLDSLLKATTFLKSADSAKITEIKQMKAHSPSNIISLQNYVGMHSTFINLLNQKIYLQYHYPDSTHQIDAIDKILKLLGPGLDSLSDNKFHESQIIFTLNLPHRDRKNKLIAEAQFRKALSIWSELHRAKDLFSVSKLMRGIEAFASAYKISDGINDERLAAESLIRLQYLLGIKYGLTNIAIKIADFISERFADFGRIPSKIRMHYYTGCALMHKGNFAEARSQFERMEKSFLQIKYTAWRPSFHERMGIVCRRLGDFKAAGYHTEQILLASTNPGNNDYINFHLGIGLLNFERGQYELALQEYEKARNLAANADPENEIVALTNIAELYIALGEYEKATHYQQTALAIAQEWQLPRMLAFSWKHLAEIYLKKGDIELAKSCIDTAQQKLQEFDFGVQAADMALNIGQIDLNIGNYEKALSSFFQAREAFDELGFPRDQLRLSNLIGETYRRLGNHKEASKSLQKAKELSESYTDLSEVWQTYHYLGLLARDRHEIGQADRHLRTSVAELKKIANQVSTPQERSSFSAKIQPVFEDMVLVQTQLGRPEKAFAYSEIERAQALKVLLRAKDEEPVAANDIAEGANFINQIRHSLSDSALVLKYEVTDSSLILWGVNKDTLRMATVAITRKKLDGLVQQFRDCINPKNVESDFAGTYEMSRNAGIVLYGFLIRPLAQMLSDATLMHVIPDEALYYVPFTVLLNGEKYLIEEKAIVQHPSAAIMYNVLNRNKIAQDRPISVLSIAAESGLLHSKQEAREVAKLAPQGKTLIGSEATEGNVVTSINTRQNDAILISSHGKIDERRPDFSHIALSQTDSDNSVFDGKLMYPEIAALNCDSTSLVFLSACESGSGKLYRGEGMVGLQRAFMIAGAKSVISNLWQIDQRFSKDLSVGFFEIWLSGKYSKIQALRQSQLTMLTSLRVSRTHNYTPHPFFWAPVIISGHYN